jgi:DNA-binding transcriptional MerR regulator
MNDPALSARTYRTGTAARLAGIPAETLRVWERRYRIVAPQVSPGRQRLYSTDDVRRLTLVKQLVDLGHPISTVARLPDAELAALRDVGRPIGVLAHASIEALTPRARVAVVGARLAAAGTHAVARDDGFELVARCSELDEAPAALAGVAADVVVIELATLSANDLPRLEALAESAAGARLVVLYRFARSALIRRLRAAGHAVARTSHDPTDIAVLCRSVVRRPPDPALYTAPTPPRFDEATLGALLTATPSLECECPRHLVELVMALGGFERYSSECANQDTDDVALHLELQRAAGLARVIIERSLERVALAEGFEVPPQPARSRAP